jgi:hypothetical protein
MFIDAGAVAAGASATPAATHSACRGLLDSQRREHRSKKRERKGRRCRASKDTAAKQEPARPGAMIASRSQISSSPRHTHAASRIFKSTTERKLRAWGRRGRTYAGSAANPKRRDGLPAGQHTGRCGPQGHGGAMRQRHDAAVADPAQCQCAALIAAGAIRKCRAGGIIRSGFLAAALVVSPAAGRSGAVERSGSERGQGSEREEHGQAHGKSPAHTHRTLSRLQHPLGSLI